MDHATQNKLDSFIWGIADDVLPYLFRGGKYPDVILPMCVLRTMDAVLKPTEEAVLDTKATITEQHAAPCVTAEQAFYNTSKLSMRDLRTRGNQQHAGQLDGCEPAGSLPELRPVTTVLDTSDVDEDSFGDDAA